MEQIAAEKRHQEEKEGKYQAELQDLKLNLFCEI